MEFKKDIQYFKFSAYGFFKNLKFFDPFLFLFFMEKGIAFAQIGVLYAIREISINILEIPSGIVADVLGRKRAMIVSFLAYITSFTLFYILQDFWGFAMAFLFYGVGDAFRSGTHKAMILSYLKRKGWEKEKTAYYGHTRSWSQRGSAIASLISAVLVFYTGSYQYVFLLSIIPYLIDLLLLISYPSYLNGDRNLSGEYNVLHLFKEHFSDLKLAFSNWKPFKIFVTTSSYTGYYKALKDYLQPLIVALAASLPILYNVDEMQKVAVAVGFIYSLLYFMNAVVSKNVSKIECQFQSSRSALIGIQLIGWIGGALSGVAYLMGRHTISVVFFAVVLLVQNARRPIALRYLSEIFDDKIMATVLSADSQSETLFAAVFAVALGVVADLLGVGTALVLLSSMLIVGNILLTTLQGERVDK